MQDHQEKQPVQQPSPPRRKYRYSPFSIIAAPLGLPFGLTIGKAIGEAMEWGKLATIAAECVIGVVAALVIAVTINFYFGKEVEVADKKSP